MPTRCFLALVLLATGCCCPLLPQPDETRTTSPAPTATAYDPAFVDAHLARLRAEAGCDAAPSAELGFFCPAVTGWASGSAAPAPSSVARVGITTWIPTEGSALSAYGQLRRFSVLGFNGDGRADITSPGARPDDPAPLAAADAVVANLRGRVGPVLILRPVHSFVVMRPMQAQYTMASTGNGWQLQGGSFADLRRVGQTWVAVEVPRNAPQGLYFSVFVDAPYQPVGL